MAGRWYFCGRLYVADSFDDFFLWDDPRSRGVLGEYIARVISEQTGPPRYVIRKETRQSVTKY